MRLFRINSRYDGAIESISFTGGYQVYSIEELKFFLKQNEGEKFYGEGVHRLGVSLEGEGIPMRVNSTSRNGEMNAIKLAGATLVDIADWKLDLELDRDEEMLVGLKINGKVPSKPTAIVINDFKAAVFKSSCYEYAKNSKVTLMEAMLSSTRIPTVGFKPAYGGGLMCSPADSSKVYEDVISYDISSSYPWTAATTKVPYGESYSLSQEDLADLTITNGKISLGEDMGFIGLFTFRGLKRRPWVKIPVIREKDAHACEGAEFDRNGLTAADSLRVALVPDSLHSLAVQYSWDDYEIEVMETHRVSILPKGIRSVLGGYYEAKERAVGSERLRAKLAINTLIGLWGTDPFKSGEAQELRDGIYYTKHTRNLPKPWATYVGVDGKDGSVAGGKRCWDYRWAVYSIAAAQRRIVETEFFLQQAGLEVLYCDTDSIKMAGDKDIADQVFDKLNSRAAATNEKLGLPDSMGLWVDESAGYKRVVFRAKKFYATEDENGNRGIHISAVPLKHAAAVIEEMTLEDLADSDDVIVQTSRPDFADIASRPFGATRHMLPRQMIRRYTRDKLLIAGGNNVQV